MARSDIVRVDPLIVTVRRQRVILAADLASVYGVATRALSQAVKRNANRFPEDFAFRLTRGEAQDIQRSRSQSVILGDFGPRGEESRAAHARLLAHPITCGLSSGSSGSR
jgi:hypothetical protein